MANITHSEPALAAPWGRHSIPSGETLAVALGPARLWARAESDEIRLVHIPGDPRRPRETVDREPAGPETAGREAPGAGPPDPEPPDEESWTRWPVPEGTDAIALSPVFPPRPVVAEPELDFRLLPGARARIFVRVPVWARVELTAGDGGALTELPTLLLSDTWWGGFTEGELCYWLPTTARRRVPPEAFTPHLAVCPLQLSNRSGEELTVEKIALRVAHLSLFGERGRLWADETRIRYRGEDAGSEIEMAGAPPPEAAGAALVAAPRTPLLRGFRARTFARLKALPGLGGP